MRIPGQEQALLVSGQLDISLQTADWVEKNLINITPDRIQHIDIVHGITQTLSLHRDEADKDLVLENIPAGKQARTDYVLERMQGILEDISIDDVSAAAKIGFPAEAITTTVQTNDGLTVIITSTVIDKKNYVKFAYQYTAPAQPEPATPPAAETKPAEAKPAPDKSAQPTGAAAPAAKTEEPKHDVAKETADLTAKTTGWVYQIPAYKFDTFTQKLDDLVEDIPKEEPTAKGPKN